MKHPEIFAVIVGAGMLVGAVLFGHVILNVVALTMLILTTAAVLWAFRVPRWLKKTLTWTPIQALIDIGLFWIAIAKTPDGLTSKGTAWCVSLGITALLLLEHKRLRGGLHWGQALKSGGKGLMGNKNQ